MAGYNGYSMSNNAVAAYANGEQPISKWTKAQILDAVSELELTDFDMGLFAKLNLRTLRQYALTRTSWHHTGKLYNATDFYALDAAYLENLTNEQIAVLLETQATCRPTAEDKAARNAERERRKVAATEREEAENLFRYQTKYKTIGGFLRSKPDFDALRRIRQKRIDERREQLRHEWARIGCRKMEHIESDSFIEQYVRF